MQRFSIRRETPDPRALRLTGEAMRRGEVALLPTDGLYTLAGAATQKSAAAAIRKQRGLGKEHPLTLLCAELGQLARFAMLSDGAFRILRRLTPGPYTFILPATREVPKQLQMKRQQVGVRISADPSIQGILEALGEPLVCASATVNGEAVANPDALARAFPQAAVMIDAGPGLLTPTTVLDCTELPPTVLREGAGAVDF